MSVARLCIRAFSTSTPLASLNAAALPKAEQISAEWKGTSATGGTTKNFIAGQFLESKSSQWIDVLDPVSHRINTTLFLTATLALSSPPRPCLHVSHIPPVMNLNKQLTLHQPRSNPGVAQVSSIGNDSSWSIYFSSNSSLAPDILVFNRLQRLIRENADAIANSIVLEQGKTIGGLPHPIPP